MSDHHPTTPCKTCPWLTTSDPSGKDIPGFDFEMMMCLESTAPDSIPGEPVYRPVDGFYRVMACHHSEMGAERACRGYLARHGDSNIIVRTLAAYNLLPLRKIVEDCKNIPLYATYFDMRDAMIDAMYDEQTRKQWREGE